MLFRRACSTEAEDAAVIRKRRRLELCESKPMGLTSVFSAGFFKAGVKGFNKAVSQYCRKNPCKKGAIGNFIADCH